LVYVFSVVGASKSGKTWLIEHIIPELISRGFTVGSIKHTPKGFEIINNKDSTRHLSAGSKIVIYGNKESCAINALLPLNEKTFNCFLFLFDLFNIDIVVVEGFKSLKIPKIVTLRGENRININEITGPILCIVSDRKEDFLQKKIKSFNDIKDIVSIIIDNYEKTYVKFIKNFQVSLLVNDKLIPLNTYIKNVIGSVLTALINTLKGVPEPKSISVHIRKMR